MKAVVLVKTGNAESAFEIRELQKPKPGPGQVLIKVRGFGLNFADVVARHGDYPDAPPLPSVLGYDVAGTIDEVGNGAGDWQVGEHVVALTRFGGYAQYALADTRALMRVPAATDVSVATALATQYCTAYYAAAMMAGIRKGEKVLIHAAAGGVGLALVQYALHQGCEIFATAGSSGKLDLLRSMGVQHTINYSTQDFAAAIKTQTNQHGVDAVFDAIGGSTFRKGMGLLAPGGRMVGFGAASMNDNRNVFSKLKSVFSFGLYHPALLMMQSKSMMGVNMLRIADHQPETLALVFARVQELYQQKVFQPVTGRTFAATEIAKAHQYLESRQSIGKVACVWQDD